MADRRKHDLGHHYAVHQPMRNRASDFETELNKYCVESDIKRYKLCKDSQGNFSVIGSGAFGKVYEAIDVGARRPVALKVMKKDHILSNRFERRVMDEIRLHSKLMHPRIVEMYECFHDKSRVYIALELCPGGDLEHYLRRGVLSEEMAASMFRQVVEGVLYLHRVKTDRDGMVVGNPVLHRDLKPSNICFAKDNSVKICDFNLAAEVMTDGQKNTTYCGTPGYMPPEVAMNLPYSFEVDAYGLGCILYSMLFGGPPGGQRNEAASSSFDINIPDSVISLEAENLLQNLLCKDARQRMPVKAIGKHPFLMRYAQRKRLASIDSGFDTQHTGSSFPVRSRRAISRDRDVLRQNYPALEMTHRLPLRKSPPRLPAHPPPFHGHRLPSPRLLRSHGRSPSARRSPSTSRLPGNAMAVALPHPMSSFANHAESTAAPIGDTLDPLRRPRSPTKEKRGQASVTKVRYVSDMVQCAYMENGDFIARFSGGKVAMKKGGSEQIIVARDKKKAELTRLEEAHFQKVLRIVHALEQVCETECGVNAACDCFPVLLDKRRSSSHNT